MVSKDKDPTDTTGCITVGDPRTTKQYHWKSEAKEDQQLSPGGPSNRRKSSGASHIKFITLSRAITESEADPAAFN